MIDVSGAVRHPSPALGLATIPAEWDRRSSTPPTRLPRRAGHLPPEVSDLQRSLFDQNEEDPQGAALARAEGIGLADAGTDAQWKATARDAVRSCSLLHPDGFTADHVLRQLALCGEKTHNVPALGAVIQAAARDGEIEKTGEVWPSTIRRRHRDLTVWRAT